MLFAQPYVVQSSSPKASLVFLTPTLFTLPEEVILSSQFNITVWQWTTINVDKDLSPPFMCMYVWRCFCRKCRTMMWCFLICYLFAALRNVLKFKQTWYFQELLHSSALAYQHSLYMLLLKSRFMRKEWGANWWS